MAAVFLFKGKTILWLYCTFVKRRQFSLSVLWQLPLPPPPSTLNSLDLFCWYN